MFLNQENIKKIFPKKENLYYNEAKPSIPSAGKSILIQENDVRVRRFSSKYIIFFILLLSETVLVITQALNSCQIFLQREQENFS